MEKTKTNWEQELQDLHDLLAGAIKALLDAVEELLRETHPETPLPRPRVFVFIPSASWPYIDETGTVFWGCYRRRKEKEDKMVSLDYEALFLLKRCRYQPRLVLRTLRRIQAATAWCLARAEGRRRMAQEIVHQQKRAMEALEAEIALQKLANS